MATSNATPVWLITGASSGFGAALAIHCIKAGHKVIGTARNVKKATQDIPDFTKLGGTWIELDVTASDVEQKIEQAAKIYGNLDVIVNNAGYSLLGALEDISDEEAHAQMETNFFGPLKVIRGALPTMRKQNSGTIVNITSVAAFDGLPTCSLYAGSKFALEDASESLAREVAKFNIKVLLVEPGAFRTNFLSAYVSTKSGISEPYQQSPVADVMKAFEGMNGKQKGDTEKGVARIFEVVTRTGQAAGLGEILRLPLGSDCVERLEKKIESFKGDLEKTRKIALSTAYVEA